jgi:uncharacterized membrane protein
MIKNTLGVLKQNKYLITLGKFVIGIIMFIIIDIFYLMSVSKYFTNMTKNIRLRKDYLLIPIFFIYIILFSTLHHFVLKNINFDKITNYAYILPQLLNAFFLGFSIYSIYELTNYALFKKWTFHMVLMDSIWGGILCTIVSSMYILFISFTNKYFNIM